MFCKNPKLIIKNGINGFSGFTSLDILMCQAYLMRKDDPSCLLKRPRGLSEDAKLIYVPCGKCLLCAQAQREEWALRCWLEANEYDSNQFITLTYSDGNEPEYGVSRREISRFMHNLREYFRRIHHHTGIRYYACGDYGGENGRAHYHIILFNCPSFGDEKKFKLTKRKHRLYTSEILKRLWGKGNCVVGAVTRQSCDYVARFRVRNYYRHFPVHLNKPFQCMSTQKGIGLGYLIKNLDRIITDDAIRVTGKITAKLPRFYDRKIAELIGEERFRKEIAIPRAERAKAWLADEIARTGLSKEKIYRKLIEKEINQVDKIIKELNIKGE